MTTTNLPLTQRRLFYLEEMSTKYITSKGGWKQLTAEDKAHIVELSSEKLFLMMCDGYREGGDPQQYLEANAQLLKEEIRESCLTGGKKHFEDWLNDEYEPVFSASVN